jgi:hypothetical protein
MKTFLALLVISGGFWAAEVLANDTSVSPKDCTAVETRGNPDCCGRCGQLGCCQKYCKVVREMKEVKKHVWVVKCEEYCTSLPNCGKHCPGTAEGCGCEATCCIGCGKCDPCAAEKKKDYIPPKCGKIREKKTLEKKEVTCKVPHYKCVVVYACANCGAAECGAEKASPPASVAPANPPPVPAPMPPSAPTT